MCLYINKKTKPKIVKKNVTCYKIVRKTYDSYSFTPPIYSFVNYTPPIYPFIKYVINQITYANPLRKEKFREQYLESETIEGGFIHSFKFKKDALSILYSDSPLSHSHLFSIIECEIPKETSFVEGECRVNFINGAILTNVPSYASECILPKKNISLDEKKQ